MVSRGETVTPNSSKSSSGFPGFGRNRDGNSTRLGHRRGVEESEADLERFQKRLTAIGYGDYFETAGRAETGSRCNAAMRRRQCLKPRRSLSTRTTKTMASLTQILRIVNEP